MRKNIVFIFVLILLSIIPVSYSEIIFLDIYEGGCVGYENTLIQAYYGNRSLINSSDYEVTIFNGPLRSFGELITFNPSDEPVRVEFDDELSIFLYEFRTENDSNYEDVTGFIELFECQPSRGIETNNSHEDSTLIIETLDENIVEILYQPDLILDYTRETTTTLEEEFSLDISDTIIIFNDEDDTQIGSIGISSSTDFIILTDPDFNEFGAGVHNISISSSFFTLIILDNAMVENQLNDDDISQVEESNSNNDDNSDLEENLDIQEETTSQSDQLSSNSNEDIGSTQSSEMEDFFEEERESRFSLSDILLYVGIFIIIMLFLAGVIYVLFSAQGAHKNTKFGYDEILRDQELPQTSLEKKIMEYCDTHKQNLSPEEVVNELVKDGYDKRRVIETLITYIERQNKK